VTGPRWAARAGVLGLAAALLASTAVAVSSPAAADESFPVPTEGLPIVGHGYGHGRGMSQHGALGAANQGVGYGDIVARYYPGTAMGALPGSSDIRVLISEDSDADVTVHPTPGLTVLDNAGYSRVLPAGPTRWRLVPAASGMGLQQQVNGTWQWFPGAEQGLLFPRFLGPARIRLDLPGGTSRAYRGVLTGVRGAGTAVSTVNTLPFEQYLWGVVPREVPASWHPEALKAQAVAARTYSAHKRLTPPAAHWDICSTTACQVYGGSALWAANGAFRELEDSRTTAAVNATAGQVRLHNGRPALTEFSSSSGGWTAAGHVPYLVAQPDPWDAHAANPAHTWNHTLTRSAVQTAWPAVGSLRRVRVTARTGHGDWGGRITSLVLEGVSSTGAATAVSLTGDQFRTGLGLRSTWWTVSAGAIQLRWLELGGSSSYLGPATSGEYSVPGGRAQDFRNGRIYWSPATGPQVVLGAVLDKYLQLGGPGGFLGLPTSDELGVPGGRRSTFQGGHLYWGPSTGAREVHGAILGSYLSLGGPGFLGLPTTDEVAASGGRRSLFERGHLYWSSSTGAQPVYGAILAKYLSLGGPGGMLGFPTSRERGTPGGAASTFQGGHVYWSAAGAFEVHGALLGKYLALGGPEGWLGHPVSDEVTVAGGRSSRFGNGHLFWGPRTGAHEVHGAILARYLELGGPAGALGLPTSDEQAVPEGRRSTFVGGAITWSASTGATERFGP
jgi:stage II sporulation protein D